MLIVDCPCDHSRPETLSSWVCGRCGTAEDRDSVICFLKDINPHQPNRCLALPKVHGNGFQSTRDLTESLRTHFWLEAARRADELYPGR